MSRSGAETAGSALLAQARGVADWVEVLDHEAYGQPSVLPGWRVAELVAHVGMVLGGIGAVAGRRGEGGAKSVAAYVSDYPTIATTVRDREVAATAGRTPAEIAATVRAGLEAAEVVVAGGPEPATVVLGGRGPIRWGDYLLTRVIELVVHADDLGRSTPDIPGPDLDRTAHRLATVTLARVLAERAPGRSVELRVPPYAAVQCVEGPRHTRGTPPNVVETDPLTWVRLAAGRLGWNEAVEDLLVRASGPRATLGPWLPVL